MEKLIIELANFIKCVVTSPIVIPFELIGLIGFLITKGRKRR